MGIKADCAEIYPLNPGLIKYCTDQKHEQLLKQYSQAIASKFDTGDTFTVSDVWQVVVAIYEWPTNTIQQALANNVWAHDFFEMNVDQFLDPNPVMTFAVNAFLLLIVSAFVSSR